MKVRLTQYSVSTSTSDLSAFGVQSQQKQITFWDIQTLNDENEEVFCLYDTIGEVGELLTNEEMEVELKKSRLTLNSFGDDYLWNLRRVNGKRN